MVATGLDIHASDVCALDLVDLGRREQHVLAITACGPRMVKSSRNSVRSQMAA